MGSRKTHLVVVIGGILIVVGVIVLFVAPSSPKNNGQTGTSSVSDNTTQNSPSSVTRDAAPSNVKVPDTNAKNLPQNVAKPNEVVPAGPKTSASFRSFTLQAQGDKFSPDTVIVKKGDTIHLEIQAVDHDYDFRQPDYGFSTSLPKGKTKIVEFQATASGKFTFFCESCGGIEKGAHGFIIITD